MIYSIATLTDNFDDNSVAAKWSKEGTAAEVLEQNGRVEISHTAAAEYNALVSTGTYNFKESYALVQVVNAGNQGITSHEAILGIRLDASNAIWFTASLGSLSAYKRVGGVSAQVGASITYSAITHAWWRLRESTGTIYWDTSLDGTTWTNRWTLANPFAISALQPFIQSGSWQAETLGSFAYFDNFNTPPVDIPPTSYQYHIYSGSTFLGKLSNVMSDFSYSQDINTSFVSISVDVALSADVATQDVEPIYDETGDPILAENGLTIYEERRPDVVSNANPEALIQENNNIKVYEFSSVYPNGLLVFDGYIESWTANMGTEEDSISFVALSNGVDADDYILEGSDTNFVSDTTNDTNIDHAAWGIVFCQVVRPTDDTILDSVTLNIKNTSGSDNYFYMDVVQGEPSLDSFSITAGTTTYTLGSGNTVVGTFPYGRITIPANTSSYTNFTYSLTSEITLSADTNYYLRVYPQESPSMDFTYFGAQVAAGAAPAGSLYYIRVTANNTNYGAPAINYDATIGGVYLKMTTAGTDVVKTYSSAEISTILTSALDNYADQGGSMTYTGASIDATTNTATYTFRIPTILDVIKKCLELAPSDWYWYVNPATQVLYFQQTPTTATHTFIKGRHFTKLSISATVENVRNVVYFSGGDGGNGVNLFRSDTNADSISEQGRRRLTLLSDNRVTQDETATLIMDGVLDQFASVAYSSPISISAGTYDISTINVGDAVALAGFGNFADYLLLQVARKVRNPDGVDLTLGVLLRRQSDALAKAEKDLNALQTIANPDSPS